MIATIATEYIEYIQYVTGYIEYIFYGSIFLIFLFGECFKVLNIVWLQGLPYILQYKFIILWFK